MKEEEIYTGPKKTNHRMLYVRACADCSKSIRMYSQPDDAPECYTNIYVVCDCDELVEFKLPVN